MTTRYAFVDDSGETRLAGTLVPDPGGFVPSAANSVEQATLDGMCASESGVSLTWTKAAGATLLSYTDPTAPTIVTAGVYAITGTIKGPNGAQSAVAEFTLFASTDAGNVVSDGTLDLGNIDPNNGNSARLPVAIVAYMNAGTTLALIASQTGTAGTLEFSSAGPLTIQRLT